MATAIPDLWADDIKVDVVTPVVILRAQEATLAQKTQGILRGQVATTTSGDWVQHQLDLIAPALRNYRVTLLRASHHKDNVYPVYVQTFQVTPQRETVNLLQPVMITSALSVLAGRRVPEGEPAYSESEFIEVVRKVLRSGDVRALIESLIARSNEAQAAEPPPASGAT